MRGIRVPWLAWPLLILGSIAMATAFIAPPLPQPQSYHVLADARGWLGVPNFLNVVSNILFLIVGGIGWRLASRARDRTALTLFISMTLVALGSAWYHLAPSDSSLVWDRLPLGAALGAMIALVIELRVSAAWGSRLLAPSVVTGVASVLYWTLTEQAGFGDLVPYLLLQAYAVLALAVVAIAASITARAVDPLLGVVGFYILAKFFEVADAAVFELGGLISGHTLKHLMAACAAGLLLWIWKWEADAMKDGP